MERTTLCSFHTSSFPHFLLPNARSQIHPPDDGLFSHDPSGLKPASISATALGPLSLPPQRAVPSDLRVTKPHGHFGASFLLAFQDPGTLMVMPSYGMFSLGYGFQAGIPITSSLHSFFPWTVPCVPPGSPGVHTARCPEPHQNPSPLARCHFLDALPRPTHQLDTWQGS